MSIADRLRHLLSGPELPWIGLWIGLTTLIVGLIVLTRTSWGQSHPLRKCAALSLLVHLLLAAFATTVQIVSAGSPDGHSDRGAINITLASDPDQPTADVAAAQKSQPAWDQFAASAADAPPTVSLARAEPPAPSETPNPELAHDPVADKPLLEKPPVAPVEPIPTKSDPATDLHQTAAVLPADPIDPTAPPKPAPAAVVRPEPSGPARQSTAAADSPAKTDGGEGASAGHAPLVKVPGPDSLVPVVLPPGNPTGNPTLPGTGDPAFRAGSKGPAPVAAITEPPPGGGPTVTDNKLTIAATPPTPADIGGSAGIGATTSSKPAPAAPPDIYKDRTAADRAGVLRRRGGSPETEAAVQAALHWLATHQEPDGHWDAAKYGAGQERSVLGQDRGGAGAKAHAAVTGLTLLAFQASGNTHATGPYAKNVQHGLEYLLSIQGADGSLGGEAETYAFMYSHGMATFAMSEAYAMTHDKRLEQPLRRAIAYTIAAQHPTTGGWRYQPRETGDTSQLGWQLMALKSAELAGLPMPQSTRDGAIRFLKSVASGPNGGLASYRPGEQPSRTMTAEALVCRQFLGMARDNPSSDEAGDALLGELPSKGNVNLYYWYYGTLGMYELQGEHWQRWNQALQTALVGQQATDGDMAGSWDPIGLWGGYGGRVYSTAMSALCLEVYYRFLPLYNRQGGTAAPATNAATPPESP